MIHHLLHYQNKICLHPEILTLFKKAPLTPTTAKYFNLHNRIYNLRTNHLNLPFRLQKPRKDPDQENSLLQTRIVDSQNHGNVRQGMGAKDLKTKDRRATSKHSGDNLDGETNLLGSIGEKPVHPKRGNPPGDNLVSGQNMSLCLLPSATRRTTSETRQVT